MWIGEQAAKGDLRRIFGRCLGRICREVVDGLWAMVDGPKKRKKMETA
jgi:hypothetical protein